MSSKANQNNANYGRGLLSTRGGWTLREMLGADYAKFHDKGSNFFTQRSLQVSTEEAESKVPDSTAPLKEK
jgi:hypothetical protein